MKFQKKLALSMALVMVALLAVGCGASNPGSTQGTKAPATEPSTEPVAITEPSTTQGTKAPATEPSTEPVVITEPSTTPETSETVASDELAKIFADFAMDVPDTLGYAVADISGDGQPELIVKTGTCEANSKFLFYAWEQNAVTEIGDVSGGHSALALDENNNLIVYGGQMDAEWAYAVSYIDGVFTVKELYNRPYPEDGPTKYDNTLDLTFREN